MLHSTVYLSYNVDDLKILKLLLERKIDLTIKNKKGQTPIDITNSKTIISLFWNYLKKNGDDLKENKISPERTCYSPKRALSKKCSAKILNRNDQKCCIDIKENNICSETVSNLCIF